MTDVTLHGFHRSTYVSIAKLVLTAKGVPFTFRDTEADMRRSGGWTLHPFERVPVLTHGTFTLYETAAIATYVDEAFLGPALSPADPCERARMNQWISAVNSYYYPWIVYHLVHERVVFRELGIAADEGVVAAALPNIRRGLDVLEGALGAGRAFLAGDRASLADYFMLPSLVALGMADEGRTTLARAPATIAWIARMAVLPEVVSVAASMPPAAPIEHARRWATDHRPAVRADGGGAS
jgi:glutathione S-transferase